MNRGIGRRTLFEHLDDIRYFLACLAREVRAGLIEIHAWCILTTHFHLLVRSPAGQLSEVMRRAQNAYVRRFNRGRRRDGPLVRGRYRSKRVDSLEYRRVLLRYIDANPVQAGLAEVPWEYPHCSARAYVLPSGPPWLERSWVEGLVRLRTGDAVYDPAAYPMISRGTDWEAVRGLVERRCSVPQRLGAADELDDLIGAAPARVLEWLRRKAELADGTAPGEPVSAPIVVQRAVERRRCEEWLVGADGKPRSGWDVLQAGLMRAMSAATQREIGSALSKADSTAGRLARAHESLVQRDPEYARIAADVAREILAGVR